MHFWTTDAQQITHPLLRAWQAATQARLRLAGLRNFLAKPALNSAMPAVVAALVFLAGTPPALSQTQPDISALRHRIIQLEARVDAGAAGSGLYGGELAALTRQIAEFEANLQNLNGRLATLKQRLRVIPGRELPNLPGEPAAKPLPAPAGGPRRLTPLDAAARPAPALARPTPGVRVLGPLPASGAADLRAGQVLPPVEPISPEAPTTLDEGRPLEIYNTAYGFILRKDYASATRAFAVFLRDFPRHDLAGNAQYWLAESYFARGKKAQAAREFLKGFKSYPNSPKAPDALLKLAISLAALGETSQACAAFREYNSKFDLEARSQGDQLAREMRNAGC